MPILLPQLKRLTVPSAPPPRVLNPNAIRHPPRPRPRPHLRPPFSMPEWANGLETVGHGIVYFTMFYCSMNWWYYRRTREEAEADTEADTDDASNPPKK